MTSPNEVLEKWIEEAAKSLELFKTVISGNALGLSNKCADQCVRNITLARALQSCLEVISKKDELLMLISGSCGVPDASEACRVILKRSKAARELKPDLKGLE